jgi:hypothetical protein
MPREALRKIQTGLAGMGHDPGPADGLWGARTRGAIMALLDADGRAAVAPAMKVVNSPPGLFQGRARYPVTEAIVHCSATRPDWKASATFAAQVAEIRRWHVSDRGWRDIGYHWLISRAGDVMAGRAETEIGAHVVERNRGTIGICLIGGHGSSEHDRFDDHFTASQEAALRNLLEDIARRARIERVTGHNQYAAKACPGFNVPAWWGRAA